MQGQSTTTYRMYPMRHVIVFLFILVQLMMAVLVNTFTPIASYLSTIYQQDPIVINMTGLMFILMHPLFTFPAAFFIDTYGARIGIFIGCAFCILGTILRIFVNSGFFFAIIGQIIAGIGRPFILNCQTKIAANWFSAQQRGGITQLLTLVLNVSLILGIFIPGLIFGGYQPAEDGSNFQQGKDLTQTLLFVQAIMALACCLPNMIFQSSKPPTPPSASVLVPRQPFKVAISALFKNRDYILLLLCFGCYFGIFNGISLVLSYLIKPWYQGDDLPFAVAAIGGSPVISGILGVIIMGGLQRKSGSFKKWITICMLGSIIAVVLFYPALESGSLFLACLVSAVNSFFLIPLVPIMLQLSCELAFPIGQGSASGMLFAMGNFSGFLFGLILSYIVQGQSSAQTAGGFGFCFGVFLIGLLLVYYMREKLNRKEYEQSSARSTQSSRSSQASASESQKQSSLRSPLISQSGSLQNNLLSGEKAVQNDLL